MSARRPKLRLVEPPRAPSDFFLFIVGVSLETHRLYSKMPAKWIAFTAQAIERFATSREAFSRTRQSGERG